MLTEETTCYRHPQNRAAVGCQRCERPICTQCMTQASIGHHCPECLSQTNQQVYTARTLPSSRPTNVLIGLIAVNVLAFLAQGATSDEVTVDGILFGPLVADGE
ncbi:MAG: rhomboid family intramembrane serine protease, partial [Actinomycetota bacterium]